MNERLSLDARHAVGEGDRGQTGATIERLATDARHAVGNGDRGQTRAIRERILTNACYVGIYNSLEIILLPYL